ncbi:M016L [Myxoma virus]|nr:M016L [Myxoma virus]
MPKTTTFDYEMGSAAVALLIIVCFIVFVIMYFNKCTALENAWNSCKLKIINATTRRSFRQLDTVYYTDDTQVGVNVE